MAISYSNQGSSLAQRVSAQFEKEFGRPANVGGVIDPQFAAWSSGAMAKLQADDKAALQRSQRNMNRVRNVAYAAVAAPFAAAAAPAFGIGAGSTANAGTAAGSSSLLPSSSLIPGALATPGGAGMMNPGNAYFASEGLKAASNLYGSKKGADAANKSARLQTAAATEAARIQADSSQQQLEYLKRQSELDRLSARYANRQNYGLNAANEMNAFNRYGDSAYNTRASELSQGRTQDRMYGARQNNLNYMRALMNMPDNPLSVYVEPDLLQLTRPTLPDYVDDTTPTE